MTNSFSSPMAVNMSLTSLLLSLCLTAALLNSLQGMDVLNGIAWDSTNKRLLGKCTQASSFAVAGMPFAKLRGSVWPVEPHGKMDLTNILVSRVVDVFFDASGSHWQVLAIHVPHPASRSEWRIKRLHNTSPSEDEVPQVGEWHVV